MKHRFEDIQGWFNFKDLYDLALENTPDNGVIVEIGAFKGKSASYMAIEIINRKRNIKFHVIDDFFDDKKHPNIESKHLFNSYKSNTFDLNIITHAMDSVKAASLPCFNFCNFVFVDASHEYKDVLNDLKVWWPNVIGGGIIAGHDYDNEQVKKAVDEFFTKRGTVCTSGTAWMVYKM